MRTLLVSPFNSRQNMVAFASAENWNLTCVESADEALEFMRKTDFQTVFVTVGPEQCEALRTISYLARNKCSSPIVACIEGDQRFHRVRALELGAVTCIQLPSSADEVRMVALAIVRHTIAQKSNLISNIIKVGDVALDIAEKRFWANKAIVPLSLREYQILELLFLSKGRLVTRDNIMNYLYDCGDEPDVKIIDVLVCKIRKKLRQAVGNQVVIETVWGAGYRTEHLRCMNAEFRSAKAAV